MNGHIADKINVASGKTDILPHIEQFFDCYLAIVIKNVALGIRKQKARISGINPGIRPLGKFRHFARKTLVIIRAGFLKGNDFGQDLPGNNILGIAQAVNVRPVIVAQTAARLGPLIVKIGIEVMPKIICHDYLPKAGIRNCFCAWSRLRE